MRITATSWKMVKIGNARQNWTEYINSLNTNVCCSKKNQSSAYRILASASLEYVSSKQEKVFATKKPIVAIGSPI